MIPFKIPDGLLADVASGKVIRIGAMLHDADTGRIIAHLQETGALQNLLATPPPGGLLLSAGQLAS
jgi:hypothetical protein